MSIPTPYIGHFTEDDYDHIYEPAEDSFILLDALEQDAQSLRDQRPSLCLEIGSGSGVVSTFLSKILGPTSLILSTDINPLANVATLKTAQHNQVTLDVVRCNLLDPLFDRVRDKVDVLVFNPPYVPTSEDELIVSQLDKDVAGAWAGGSTGMRVTNLILDRLPEILAPNGGRFYLVAIAQNRPEEIVNHIISTGLQAQVVLKRPAGGELLSIIRVIRT